MAGRRYSRIQEATKLYSAVDNYIKYITDSTRRGTRVGTGDPRPPSIKLYVRPFTEDLPTGQKVQQSAAQPSWTLYGSHFGSRTSATAPTGQGLLLKLAGFKAARVVIATGRSNTGVAKTSAVTGLKYLDYGGKTTSIPFGASSDADTPQDAFDAIRDSIIGGGSFNGSITLRPEVYPVV